MGRLYISKQFLFILPTGSFIFDSIFLPASLIPTNTHLICQTITHTFSSNSISLMGKVNGDRVLSNTSTFPLLLISQVIINLIMTQSAPVETIPYIISSFKASLYLRFFLLH